MKPKTTLAGLLASPFLAAAAALGGSRAARSEHPAVIPDKAHLPRHVAIIMDGNGRWATKRHLPRVAGHRAGVEAVRDIIKACSELGIEVLTLYSFSTENWKRPQDEVEALMRLLAEYLRGELNELHRNNVKILPIGRIDEMPMIDRVELNRAVATTSGNTGLQLNLALNYGARAELTDAVRAIAEKVRGGALAPADISPELISDHLYTAGQPDPDLLIRTGGESRLSNFMLWQLAYTEIWVTPTYWPDFKPQHLRQALADFAARERRFGGINAR